MTERIVKTLPVQLTEAQVNEWARKAAALAGEEDERATQLESARERAKTIVKEAESALSSKRIERSQAARIARERCEWKEVDCEERIARADRRATVTRLDTHEHVSSRPVSDDEMRRGATWKPNYTAGRSELRHPEEPSVLLDTRPLSDTERQVPLPNAEGEVTPTTLAEAAAIAEARANGDLPPDAGEPYEPKGPATTVTSEQLDKLTGVEAKPESKSPRDVVFGAGIEQTNGAAGPKLPQATVFSLLPANAQLAKRSPLFGLDWVPSADGGLESQPLGAGDADALMRDLGKAKLLTEVAVRTVTGLWSEEFSEISAAREAYEALSDAEKDRLAIVTHGDDDEEVPGQFVELEKGVGGERVEWSNALSRAEVVAVKLACSGVGLPLRIVPAGEFSCAEPGCGERMLLGDVCAGVLCAKHAAARAEQSEAIEPEAKPAKKSKKAKAPKGSASADDAVAKHTATIDATKSAGALGTCWVEVMRAKLPAEAVTTLAGVWNAKAHRMGLSASTMKDMRARGEAPAWPSPEDPAPQPTL